MNSRTGFIVLPLALILAIGASRIANAGGLPTGGGFTYQGVLRQNGQLYNGDADFEFRMYDSSGGATQIGQTITNTQTITDGASNTFLLFEEPPPAQVWNGDERWLEIRVRTPAGSGNPFATLNPRQKITTTPYAAYALNATLPGIYGNAVNFNNPLNNFSGEGAGLTNLSPANLAAGTAAISITGSAASAATSGNVTGIVAIANGGTGASNAGGALTSLGAAAASHSHTLSALTGFLLPGQLPTGGGWSLTTADLNIDANTLVVDRTNNRVGIGLATPAADLHIRGAAGLGSLIITPTLSNSISQITLAEDSANTTGMVIRHDGNANRLEVLAKLTGVDQPPVLSINRTSTPGIGIGTITPLAALHVQEGTAGTIAPISNASLVLERGASNYLQMYTPDANECGLLFGGDTLDLRGGIVFNSGAITEGLQFRTGGNTARMVLDSTGNVGIGTTAPESRLHVLDGSAGTVIAGTSAVAAFERNADAFVYLLTPAADASGMFFGSPIDAEDGGIVYNALSLAPGSMQFRTGGNLNRLTISGTGDVGIGDTFPSARLHVVGGAARFDGGITIPVTTRTFSLWGAGFTLSPDGRLLSDFSIGASILSPNGTTIWAGGPVNLPDGAVVTQFRATVTDASENENVTVELVRRNLANLGDTLNMASLSTSGSSGTQFLSTSTIASQTIDNDPYAYYAKVVWDKDGTLIDFKGIRITYTITTPLP